MLTKNQLCSKLKTRLKVKRKVRTKALMGCPFKKGMCVKITTMKPKKPNSAIRKIAKVKLSTKRRISCYIPGLGHTLRDFCDVLVRGGRVKDLPGIQYHLVRGKYDFECKEVSYRKYARSKYGIRAEDVLRFYNKNVKRTRKRNWL